MTQLEDTSLSMRPFRGFLRTLSAILIVLTFTSICWCVWAHIAHRRLQAQIDAIATLHQPFNASDFPVIHLSDQQNGAVLWPAAIAARPATDTCPSGSNLVFNGYPPYPLQWEQMEDQSITDNVKTFEIAHRAAACDVDWGAGARLTSTGVPFNGSRAVANILGDAVIHAHLHGNDTLAIRRVNDILQLSRAVSRTGNLIGRLVGIGIEALCLDRLLSITPDLVIAGDPANAACQTGVERKEVEALITRLLDERESAQLRIDAIDGERMIAHQNEFKIEKDRVWTLGPLIDLSEAHVLVQLKIARSAAEAMSESAVATIYQANPTAIRRQVPFGKPPLVPSTIAEWAAVYEEGWGSFDRYITTDWRVGGDRRAAAIAMAIRLYRLDQGGWPTNLVELVPNYLPAVPADPFSATGGPIGYFTRRRATPDGKDRPMLYFGLTGNPETISLPSIPVFDRMQAGGQLRDLSRWYPATAPASPTTESSQ